MLSSDGKWKLAPRLHSVKFVFDAPIPADAPAPEEFVFDSPFSSGTPGIPKKFTFKSSGSMNDGHNEASDIDGLSASSQRSVTDVTEDEITIHSNMPSQKVTCEKTQNPIESFKSPVLHVRGPCFDLSNVERPIESVVCAAWALVLSSQNATQAVCFGLNSSIAEHDSKSISSVDVSVATNHTSNIADFLELERRENVFIDDLVANQAKLHPSAEAICAWDAGLSYGQLLQYAERLGNSLTDLGVTRGTFVPIIFEKCAYSIIAILGVLRAGDKLFIERLPLATPARTSSVSRDVDDALYVVFTSGSTGKPKGVVVTHAAFASSAKGFSKAIYLDSPSSRVLQYSSFSFDISMLEIFTSLMAGACLCIPSEEQRMNDLTACISSMNVDWAMLTPSVASLISPGDVPSLDVLCLVGEALPQAVADTWADHVKTINAYGPAECSALTIVSEPRVRGVKSISIGRPANCAVWIVNENGHLAPFNAVGEIVIEGPPVARGYLGDDVKTKEVFLDDPEFLRGVVRHPGRCYRTGDLGRMNPDGSIDFLGRKDSQVKINGQRVELGEIEHQLKKLFCGAQSSFAMPNAPAWDVAVELLRPRGTKTTVLSAFVACSQSKIQNHESSSILVHETQSAWIEVKSLSAQVLIELAERLPTYMVPKTIVPCHKLPLSASGKTDRKALRKLGSSMTLQQLMSSPSQDNPPTPRIAIVEPEPLAVEVIQEEEDSSEGQITLLSESIPASESSMPLSPISDRALNPVELVLRKAWAKVLSLLEYSIKSEDDFFRLGGDSIGAIKVVAACRQLGLQINVASIFKNSVLRRMALVCKTTTEDKSNAVSTQPTPFQFLNKADVAELREEVCFQCEVQPDDVEDMYPCTHMQEVTDVNGDVTFVWTIHHMLYDGWSLAMLCKRLNETYHGRTVKPATDYRKFVDYTQQLESKQSSDYWQSHQSFARAIVRDSLSIDVDSVSGVTVSTVVRAAWALMISHFSRTNDVLFGATVSGRNAPLEDIDNIEGPTIATVPVRVSISKAFTVLGFLRRVQDQATAMIPFEQAGIQQIKSLNEDTKRGCEFQNLLVVQAGGGWDENGPGPLGKPIYREEFTTFPVTCEVWLQPGKVEFATHVDEDSTTRVFVAQAIETVKILMTQLSWATSSTEADCELSRLAYDLLPSETDAGTREDVVVPVKISATITELISEQSAAHPGKEAVTSTLDALSYDALEAMSSALAIHLRNVGVAAGDFVPLCFEKSVWTVVAMLAAMKADAAFVPLDPAQPISRLRTIISQIKAKVAIVSAFHSKATDLGVATTVVADRSFLGVLLQSNITESQQFSSNPENPAYVVFTSGSTGTPKGVVISHSAFASGATAHGKALGISSDHRVLQFSSYTFDASLFEILTTLIHGGTVCVPTEKQRVEGILDFVKEMNLVGVLDMEQDENEDNNNNDRADDKRNTDSVAYRDRISYRAEALKDIKQELSERVPSIMVPRHWVDVEKLSTEGFPLSISGKANRKLILSWIEKMSAPDARAIDGPVVADCATPDITSNEVLALRRHKLRRVGLISWL
ncbi:Nonribosomal peptide synthase atnA [Colletotrichum sp. SAR 10_98]|nr:Nonribosomal peptide synthase atnA [Colletotrichum sp. SAR 10_98]